MVRLPRDESAQRRNNVFRRRSSVESSLEATTTRRTRYVDDGHLVLAPRNTSVDDAQTFIDAGSERTALLLYPYPTPADVAELAES